MTQFTIALYKKVIALLPSRAVYLRRNPTNHFLIGVAEHNKNTFNCQSVEQWSLYV